MINADLSKSKFSINLELMFFIYDELTLLIGNKKMPKEVLTESTFGTFIFINSNDSELKKNRKRLELLQDNLKHINQQQLKLPKQTSSQDNSDAPESTNSDNVNQFFKKIINKTLPRRKKKNVKSKMPLSQSFETELLAKDHSAEMIKDLSESVTLRIHEERSNKLENDSDASQQDDRASYYSIDHFETTNSLLTSKELRSVPELPSKKIEEEFNKNPKLKDIFEKFYLSQKGSVLIKTFQIYCEFEKELEKVADLFSFFKKLILSQLKPDDNIEEHQILDIAKELFLHDLWKLVYKENKEKNDNIDRAGINIEYQEQNNQLLQYDSVVEEPEYLRMDGNNFGKENCYEGKFYQLSTEESKDNKTSEEIGRLQPSKNSV